MGLYLGFLFTFYFDLFDMFFQKKQESDEVISKAVHVAAQGCFCLKGYSTGKTLVRGQFLKQQFTRNARVGKPKEYVS